MTTRRLSRLYLAITFLASAATYSLRRPRAPNRLMRPTPKVALHAMASRDMATVRLASI